MSWKIEIRDLAGIFDAVGHGIKKDILDLGLPGVRDVSFAQVYTIEGGISEEQARKICEELLVDPIAQEYKIVSEYQSVRVSGEHVIEVA